MDSFCEFWPCRLPSDGKPILGTGPCRVVEFERQNNIGKATLQRIAPAQTNRPYIIIATHEPNGEKRLGLLRDGEIDVALNLERADNLEVLNFDPALRWGRVTSSVSAMYYLNCISGVFKSPDARLAANLAVDTTALVKDVFRGFALPSATIVSPFHLGFKEAGLRPIPYDADTARKLLVDLTPAPQFCCTPLSTCPNMPRRYHALLRRLSRL